VAETFFLSSLATYLGGAGLTPAPAQIGGAEPSKPNELPAIVLSLESTARVNPGVGQRAQLITDGILPWSASIDLENPVLPEEPTFRLLDPTRRQLILPHGGLVRADGSDPGTSPLAPADITVKVGNAQRTVVSGDPGPNEVRADGRIGLLTFGAALPATGTVTVNYLLGQWEQRVDRIAGVLRVDACTDNADDTLALSDAVVDALLAPAAQQRVQRLVALTPVSLGSIGLPETAPKVRRRTLRMSFTFEQEINRPDSSGGIIARIPVTSRLGDGADPPGIIPQSSEPFTIPA
jgi:hypothetical protein